MAQPLLSDLIADAFYEDEIYSPGESIDADHLVFAGNRLNSMIDSWKAERLTIYRLSRTGPFALANGVATYLIGSGATWNTPRPIWIDQAGLVQTVGGGTPTPEYPIQIYTDYEWAKVVVKTLQSTIPTALWYDRTYTAAGYGTINIWPVPTVANQVVLYSPVPVDEFAIPGDLGTVINFPPAYRDFLMYQLALRIGPAFGHPPSESTGAFANLAMEKVKNSNIRLNTLRVDDMLIRTTGGFYNWTNDSSTISSR